MSTDLQEKELPEAEVALETNGDLVKANGSSEDVSMEDETEKMQRAARQSVYPGHSWFVWLCNNHNVTVEFYFADSNLPFDR